jgi:adenosylmethionine-8-amino-7-oxononanoate aminotransferase
MEDLLRTHHTSLAAVIIEPVVQGIQHGREILNQWSFMLVM